MVDRCAKFARNSRFENLWITAAFVIVASLAYRPSGATTLADKLAGDRVPDFTVTYACRAHSALDNVSRQQVTVQVKAWYTAANRYLSRRGMPVLPANSVNDRTDMIMNELSRTLGTGKAILTISKRANRLLVRLEYPGRKTLKLGTFLYDGKRSLFTYRGSEATVDPGFQYANLRDFVFPGCGVCDVAMCRNLTRVPGSSNKYTGEIAFNDGGLDDDGRPRYVNGIVGVAETDGEDCVTSAETHDPGPERFQQRCLYSDYRRAGSRLLFPGLIQLTEWYKPGSILKYGAQYTADYTLKSASDKALPESEFEFETQLPEEALVNNTSAGKTETVRYVPGKPLDEQIKADAEDKRVAELAATPESVKHPVTRYIAMLATVLAICAWYLYRRAISRSNGEGR